MVVTWPCKTRWPIVTDRYMDRDIGVRTYRDVERPRPHGPDRQHDRRHGSERGVVPHVSSRLVRRARLSATSHTTIHEETHVKRLTYTVTEAAAIPGISRTSTYQCLRRGGRSRR